MTSLVVEQMPTRALIPYASNAKIHTKEQVQQICNSIEEFGFNDPIAVWTNDRNQLEIIEGHGRVMAAKQLGMDEVPVIRLDHMSDEQRRAYTHVHNQLTMNTGWDFDTLDEELANLDFDWDDFGFAQQDIDFDPDSFFGEVEEKAVKIPDTITCPHCGEEFVPER